MAPIVRNNDGIRELTNVRWRLRSSWQTLFKATTVRADNRRAKGKDVDFQKLLPMEPDRGTTNVRNISSKHLTRWLGVEIRCVVAFMRFGEPDPKSKVEGAAIPNAWFARDESEPLMFFAGIWVKDWHCVRKVKDGLITSDLYGFLTTEPIGIVGPIHEKAMPAILKDEAEVEMWLTAPWSEAKALQRPLPDEDLVLLPRKAQEAVDTGREPLLLPGL